MYVDSSKDFTVQYVSIVQYIFIACNSKHSIYRHYD